MQMGRYPAPRRMPLPNLLYAQVVKRRARGRVVEVTHQVVFGEVQQVEALLATSATSTTINTSFVERENLSGREHNRRLTRKTIAFSKELPWLEKQLWLALAGLDHGVGHFRPLSITRQRPLLAYHFIAMSHEGLCQVF